MISVAAGNQGKRRKAGQHTRDAAQVRKDRVTAVAELVSANKEVIRYLALFLSACLALYFVYYFLTLRDSLSPVRNLTAHILGALFSVGGAEVVVKGAKVSISGFGLEIIDECTAVFSSIVYCSAVLAYPTTAKNKSMGIAFGVPSLYAINIFRLAILALVGISHPALFDFVHVYLWQASFIIFVVVIFLLWLKLLEKV